MRTDSGAVAIIVAIALIAIVGVLALVADVGQFFLTRRQLQTAADSAVLAAAMDLGEHRGTETAEATALQYADHNVAGEHRTSVSFPAPNRAIVRVRATEPTFFGTLFGVRSVGIQAEAIADAGPVVSMNETVPIIVPFQMIDGHVGPGSVTSFELGGDTGDPNAAQRGFFWLANFSGGSAGTPDYADWIVNGYPGEVSVGMIGNGDGMKAALDSAVAQRMADDPSVILPLYDYREAEGGNKAYHVVGFAEFVITGFNFQGNPKTISGYFTTGTVVDGQAGSPPVDYGVAAVQLRG